MATNNAVNTSLLGQTGTGSFVGSTSPTLTTPRIVTSLIDSAGNTILGMNPKASSVNNFRVSNGSTGNAMTIDAQGSDTNIIVDIGGKGTGGAQVKGTGAADNASTGYVGEFFSSVVLFASSISLTTATPADVTSIVNLPAGDYDIFGNVFFNFAGGAGSTNMACWISSTSATAPDASSLGSIAVAAMSGGGVVAPTLRFSLGIATTIYLSCQASFAAGTGVACGAIYARRRR